MNDEPDPRNKSEQQLLPIPETDSALSVIHRIGLRYSEKIDYLKSASIPLEESIRISNKHAQRQRERQQRSADAQQNNEL